MKPRFLSDFEAIEIDGQTYELSGREWLLIEVDHSIKWTTINLAESVEVKLDTLGGATCEFTEDYEIKYTRIRDYATGPIEHYQGVILPPYQIAYRGGPAATVIRCRKDCMVEKMVEGKKA